MRNFRENRKYPEFPEFNKFLVKFMDICGIYEVFMNLRNFGNNNELLRNFRNNKLICGI